MNEAQFLLGHFKPIKKNSNKLFHPIPYEIFGDLVQSFIEGFPLKEEEDEPCFSFFEVSQCIYVKS